jgi:hypothetical protein
MLNFLKNGDRTLNTLLAIAIVTVITFILGIMYQIIG